MIFKKKNEALKIIFDYGLNTSLVRDHGFTIYIITHYEKKSKNKKNKKNSHKWLKGKSRICALYYLFIILLFISFNSSMLFPE